MCFAVWTLFSILGLDIRRELGLSETQFGLLIATPALTGSTMRLPLGILADRFGGRPVFATVMLLSAGSILLASRAHSYPLLLLTALGVGMAGGCFAVGVTYVSKFFPPERQGVALGIFGAGNVGAAISGLISPFLMVSAGWQSTSRIWGGVLIATAVLFLLVTRREPARPAFAREQSSLRAQFAVLHNLQVWRFSLYYFFLFGAFVALALWLPRYLIGVYGVDVRTAGVLAAFFSVPAALFRIYGGRLSDRFGARAVMYWSLGMSVLCTFILSYPPTDYVIHGLHGPITFSTSLALIPFLVTLFVLGFFMSLGMAAVFKHIPVYYPDQVGAVGGLVGMVGGLGGFVLPLAFGILSDVTGIWTSCFALLFLLVTIALAWMHVAITQMKAAARQQGITTPLPELPEMAELHAQGRRAPARARRPRQIQDWRPDDADFWRSIGRAIARRNLWISTYCLLLSFAVWMVWSVVVAQLPSIGFGFTTDQLFWLAALPGISGASLRIFYAFLVPIFGGRLWTTMSTASLLLPAFGIGYAVQNPETPYLIFLVLALLCGLGGGNFASSMANISFFFPKTEKGNALALNAGLGNLGVSLMQFLVPIAVTMGLFGALGGQGQTTLEGTQIWMQNAGFIWIPLIIVGTFAAWFGMNDLLSAKSSVADQATIFSRLHTWIMCWLYTGTFGTFIGMSAGFPLLTELVFPERNALRYAFVGPLLGALSRAGSGWIADWLGGARVTLWVFIAQIGAIAGMLWSLDVHSFPGFLAMVLFLFFVSGVGNASVFQMVPVITRMSVDRTMADRGEPERKSQAERESAAVIGFTSAIAAFGAFYIPKAYGSSIDLTGGAEAALWGFLLFYLSCAAITWAIYARPRGMLGNSSGLNHVFIKAVPSERNPG
jgi:NNP family nitrate/nitrite transporter-like MFS transporter